MTAQSIAYQPAAPNGAVPPGPRQRIQGVSFTFMGDAKAGKSNLADSGPQPRLIVDVEGQALWTASRKIEWDPYRQTAPQPPDRRMTAGYGQPSFTPQWESCLVIARDYRALETVYGVLNTGRHPFSSASLDSVTEAQQRIIDGLVGLRQMELQHWGMLLRRASWILRGWRDLIVHPVKPLWSVSFVAGITFDHQKKKMRPLLQGSAQDYAPYYPDVTGMIWAEPGGQRWLKIGPDKLYETGERLGGCLPEVMPVAYPGWQGWSVESMVRRAIEARRAQYGG